MKMIRPVLITDALYTSSNIVEDDFSEYDAGTTYGVDDQIIVLATHRIYKSLIDANTGNYPPDNLTSDDPEANPIAWKDAGATNKWRVFDQVVGNQAELADSIEFEVTPGVIVDAIAFQNLEGTTAQVSMTDLDDGQVYDQEITLISTGNVFDWYDYFFAPILKVRAAVLWDLPPYPDAAIAITISDVGGVAKCGEIILGQQRQLGTTMMGLGAGITDYSIKKYDDELESYDIEKRAYHKETSCNLRLNNYEIDDVYRILTDLRATPVVWVAIDGYASFNVYGFYKDFQIEMSYANHSECSLEIEGLT